MPEFGSDRMWGLKELPLPELVSWLPSTGGWLVVALALLSFLGWAGWYRFRLWQRERYRRDALARIDLIEKARTALSDLPMVLKVTALAAFPRREVAGLRGDEWVNWLNANGGQFLPDDAIWLDRLPYASQLTDRLPAEVTERLVATSRHWVRNHRARV